MWQVVAMIRRMFVNRRREILLAVVIVVLSLIFGAVNSTFLSPSNLASIISNNAVYGIMAIGMMFVISTGNIDVSAGAQLALVSMLTAKLVSNGIFSSVPMLMICSLVTGLALGFINGSLVAYLKIPAIIVTLATLNIIRGGMLLTFSSSWISGLPDWFTETARFKPFGGELKITAYYWILACILAAVFLYKSVIGRRIIAVGANPEGARRIGFEPKTSYIWAFTIMGATSGLAAFLYTANVGIAQAVAGNGYEMSLIAAVVIGGTSFNGGKASILGTFLGVLLLGVIENGLVTARVPLYWQEFVTGVVIIAAIISSIIRTPIISGHSYKFIWGNKK